MICPKCGRTGSRRVSKKSGNTLIVHRRRFPGGLSDGRNFYATDICVVRFQNGPDRGQLRYQAKRAGLIAAIRMEQKFKAMEDVLRGK